jgi:xylan 1,4-beta-xylosidase
VQRQSRAFAHDAGVVICALLSVCLNSVFVGSRALAAEISIDCSSTIGNIRALQGMNAGPLNDGGTIDLSADLRQLAIPLTRLHDCHWPNPDVVDIHVLFPNFDANPDNPESYDFAGTDDYIHSIVDEGSGVLFRLGESIELTRTQRHVHPPQDPEKWASVCRGIVRHYNRGWAKGFHYNIRQWEIWNEPDNRPQMWTGSDVDYYRLYATAAKAIKHEFPDVLIGGPGASNSGTVGADQTLKPAPFVAGFIAYCKRESAPLDFFSWHMYAANPEDLARQGRAIRRWLDGSDFPHAQSYLDEWNYLPDNDWSPMRLAGQGVKRRKWFNRMSGAEGAAFVDCALVALQDSRVDAANYYRADATIFGLFDRYGVPARTYYAFRAFRMLMETPVRIQATGTDAGHFYVCAGTNSDGSRVGILISNFDSRDGNFALKVHHLPWNGGTRLEEFRVGTNSSLEKVRAETIQQMDTPLDISLKSPAVCLVRLIRQAER